MTLSPPRRRPPRSTINVEAIPTPLKDRPQWAAFRYGFRDGTWTKIPKQPNGKNAKSDDPTTWSPFKDVLAAFERDQTLDGIGYVFAEDDPFCGVDIDKLRDDPERRAWALGIVQRFGTYAEWSVSGNGLHAIGKGRMPDADGTPQKGRNDQAKGLEAYSRRRFFTFTGRVVEGASTAIVDVQEHLDWLLEHEFKPRSASRPGARTERTGGPVATTDRIERIKERMFSGPRGDQLRRLYAGDASDYRKADGSPDWSSADLSFCSGAWYYADGDEATVEAIWLSSGLASARPNGAKLDRDDYRRDTLATARGSKTFRDTHGYSAWEDPPRIEFTLTRPEPPTIGKDGATTYPDDQPATLEDALALIAQLRQENAELSESNRDLLGWVDRTAGFVEELQTINAGLRAEITPLREFVTTIDDVMANPDLSATDKVVSFVMTRDLHTRLSQGRTTIALARIAERTGMHKNTVGKSVDRLCTGEGAPFKKNRFRDPDAEKELGHPVLKLEIIPQAPSARDTLAAVASYEAPEDRPKRGASPKAAENRWKRCEQHQAADVLVRGTCTDCGKVLGERTVSPDEFESLKHTLGVLGPPAASVDVLVPMGNTLGVLEPQPIDLPTYAASRPPRCTTIKPNGRECRSLEYRDLGGGRLACLGCGAQTALAMVGAQT